MSSQKIATSERPTEESVSVGNWLITDDRDCDDPLEGFFPLPYTHTHTRMFVIEDRGMKRPNQPFPPPPPPPPGVRHAYKKRWPSLSLYTERSNYTIRQETRLRVSIKNRGGDLTHKIYIRESENIFFFKSRACPAPPF